MHELGIVVHVINQVEELAKQNNVKEVVEVTLEIGEVSGVIESYFCDCFEWSKKKTTYMKNCKLNWISLKGITYCEDCGKTYSTTEFGKKCPHCGSERTYLVTGKDCAIKDIKVI